MSRIVRNVLIGSALAMAGSAQTALNNIDVATAEAVPTSCSAAQMTSIYNTCVDHCQSQLTTAMVECSDINTRYMLVKCAAETDKCGSAAGSTVVKEAQVQRLQDVCKTATKFPLADVKLLFASASDVAESTVAQKQVKDLADSFARNSKKSETSKGWRKGSERIVGDNVTLSSTGGLYNGPNVVGGNINGTLEHTMPGLEKRRQHTNYNLPSAVPGVPAVGQSSESGSPRKPHVSEGSSSNKGESEQKNHSGVREYTWSKDSKSPEHKGTGKQESEGKGKSVGSGHVSASGTEAGKPEYKGVGSGSVVGSASGSVGVSGSIKKINGSSYSNTTQFKSSIKPNSVAKIVPAVSAVLAVALTAFFSL